jgi:hypothetical protein
MKFYGNLTGPVAGGAGKKKGAPGLSIKGSLWKIIMQILESMNGLTGEFRYTSRSWFLNYGRINLMTSICMTLKL